MPYASDKQRKFMHAVHPEIAKRWDEEIRKQKKRGDKHGRGHEEVKKKK